MMMGTPGGHYAEYDDHHHHLDAHHGGGGGGGDGRNGDMHYMKGRREEGEIRSRRHESPVDRRGRVRSRSRSPRGHRPRRHSRSRSRSPRNGFQDRGNFRERENPNPNRCLGVFGLSLYTQEQDLDRVFSKYGRIDKIQIVYDVQTGRSRGFGFVYFRECDDAEKAREKLDGIELAGRKIRVDFSVTQRPHSPTPGVYMGKLTKRELREREMDMQRRGGGGGGGGGGRMGGGFPPQPRRRSRSPPPSSLRRRSRTPPFYPPQRPRSPGFRRASPPPKYFRPRSRSPRRR